MNSKTPLPTGSSPALESPSTVVAESMRAVKVSCDVLRRMEPGFLLTSCHPLTHSLVELFRR